MANTKNTGDLSLIDLCVIGLKRKTENNVKMKDEEYEDGEREEEEAQDYDDNDDSFEQFKVKISVSKSTRIADLWEKFTENGLEPPDYIECDGKNWYKHSTKPQMPSFEEIEVVEDRPSQPGKCININDTLISYANAQYGKALELNVTENASNPYMFQMDSLKDSRGLEIMFHRTIRMPDDEKLHQLPGSLGTFPIYNVAGYADVLPENIVRDGGVFMPMWQREALWIDLSANYSAPYALRFSIGLINAVSGLKMNETPGEMVHDKQLQDYIVVPGQEWIDGICVAPGIVRQFVAMPLGSGYTIEGQKTGEEKHGGLQIEIIPSFQKSLRIWFNDADTPLDPDKLYEALTSRSIDEHKTPLELGLGVGARIRSFPAKPLPRLSCVVSDIVKNRETYFQVELVYNSSSSKKREQEVWKSYRIGSSKREKNPRMARNLSPAEPMSISHAARVAAEDTTVKGVNNLLFSKDFASTSMRKRDSSPPVAASYTHSFDYVLGSAVGNDGPAFGRESSEYNERETANQSQSTNSESVAIPHITTKDLTAMGLAAGGKLVQDIYCDHNPAQTWNTAAAKIVHVHILDPTSCEAITHVVPPPPPIDAMGYAEGGGQFFVIEEQPEARLEGGDFQNIKSVSAMDREKSVQAEVALDPRNPVQCKCGIRMCDCVIRPCGHVFCNGCIREVDPSALNRESHKVYSPNGTWECPTCNEKVSWVAGFAAPMNLPGEEGSKIRVPVNILKVEDGRVAFQSIQKSRM